MFWLPLFSDTLQIVTLQYPPYQYEEDGVQKGFMMDIIKETFARMNYEIKIGVYPFKRSLYMIEHGEADAIFTAAKNAEREVYAEFSQEVIVDQKMSFFVRKDSDISFNGSLESMAKYRITAINGYRYGKRFDSAVDDKILVTIERTNSVESCAQMLRLNRVDLWICNREQAVYTIRQLGLEDEIRELETPVEIIPSYIGFSRKRNLQAVRERFDSTLREMKNDGTYDSLINHYWNEK